MSVIYRAFTGFAAISAATAAAADIAAYAASGGLLDPAECPHCQCEKKSAEDARPLEALTTDVPVEPVDFSFAATTPPETA